MSRLAAYLRNQRIQVVTRTNLNTNPKPVSTSNWRISGGETLTFLADDRGEPALEALDPVGDGGLYLDSGTNFTPALNQWIGFAYELCALDKMTADRMRMTFGAYNGDSTSVGPLATPLTRPRINLVTDPRATLPTRWLSAGNPFGFTETAVVDSYDGPLLPDGTRVSSYMRYTVGSTGTGNTWFGFQPTTPVSNPYPAGTQVLLSIYVRASRATTGMARMFGREIDMAGTIAGNTFSPTYTPTPQGEWVRLSVIYTAGAAAGDFLPYAHFSNPVWQPGDTIDVVCALTEPYTAVLDDHFDAAMKVQPDLQPVWAGAANASISRGLRPYQRFVHAARLATYDPAGYIRALAWPNPQVATPNNGFRLRRAVLVMGPSEAEVRRGASSYFDGTSPGGSWSGTANASTSIQRLQMVAI